MDSVERLWRGLVLEPMNEETIVELLALRNLHRSDVDQAFSPGNIDRKLAREKEDVALELLAERGAINASRLFKTLGGKRRHGVRHAHHNGAPGTL